jgi:hypothetical protein
MQNFQNSKNKFKYVYLLTPQGNAEKLILTNRFLKLKIAEYEALELELEIKALKFEVNKLRMTIRRPHQPFHWLH